MKTSMLAVAVSVAACQSSLDTTRTPDGYASFGAVIYREACQRVAYTGQLAQREAGLIDRVDVSGSLGRSVCVAEQTPPAGAPPKLFALVDQHPAIVELVNTVLPKSFLDTLETFLERILPVYDDGTMERAVSGLGNTLSAMANDPDLPPALARLSTRRGYRPTTPGLVEAVVQYPELDAFVGGFLGLVGPGGAAEASWHALVAGGSIAASTATPEPDPAAKDRTLKLAVDLLFTRHPDLVQGTPLPTVARDIRGMAQVASDDSGVLVAPFVDTDRDGLADVDAAGRFVGAGGAPLAVATPFPEFGTADSAPRDALGRALTAAGETTTLYRYLDLDGTLLSGAAREAPVLLDASKDTALGFAWGGQALLGPRKTQTRTYTGPGGATASISFNGFDTTQSPALDLLHAFVQLAGAPAADGVLQSAATLLDKFESPTSRVVANMLETSDRGKLHTEAQVPSKSTIFDDLIPLIARTLRVPGLAQELIKALQLPKVRELAPMIARMMIAKDQIDFDHTASPSGGPNDVVGSLNPGTPVDRAQPDSDYNRSLMQRIAHLVHDSNGRRFCNKPGASAFGQTNIPECGLFQIDDLALFYALNMASRSVIDDRTRVVTTRSKASFREQSKGIAKTLIADSDLGDTFLSGTVGIIGFNRFPTPKALNRALFLNTDPQNPDPGASPFLRNTAAPIPCSDGDRFIDVHNKSIFAWELPAAENGDTFYDAVQPLIDAFAKFDECAAYDANQKCIVDAQSRNAVKIFVDLISVLHEHWSSPQSSYFGHTYQATDRAQPRFAFPDNVVSFEPLLAEVLTGDLVPSLIDLAPTLDTFTIDGQPGGQRALPILIDAMRYVFDPQAAPASLTYRSGATATVQADGITPVARATPYYLLADGFAGKRAVFAALSATPDGAAQVNKWKSAVSILIDEILTVDHVGDNWQFHNRRIHAVTQLLLRFLHDRVQAHMATGDYESWIRRDLTSDITDKLAGPVVAPLTDIAAHLEHDDGARAQFYALLNYFMNETVNPTKFQIALTLLADQLQLFLDDRDLVPIAHALGAAMDVDKGVVEAGTALIKRSHDYDTDKALLTILHNLYQPGPRGPLWVSDLADIASELNRSSPGHGGDLDANDERTLLGELAAFVNDNQRGFIRFVKIVKNRVSK